MPFMQQRQNWLAGGSGEGDRDNFVFVLDIGAMDDDDNKVAETLSFSLLG